MRLPRFSSPMPLVATLVAATLLGRAALAQNAPGRADALRQQAAERLKALHQEADRLLGQERSLLGQLRKLELARQIANEELKQAEAGVDDANASLAALDRQVGDIEQARERERPKLAARFVDLYKLGRGRYVRMFLSASDMRSVGLTARTVAELADRDRARVREYEHRLVQLDAARGELRARQQALESRRREAALAQANAAQAVATQAALVRRIDEQRDLNAQLVSELLAAQQKLDATVAGVTAGSAAAVAGTAAPAGAAGGASGLPIAPFRGALPWPATGTVQARSRAATAARPGLEIQADEGSMVHAVHAGTVAFAGSFEGLGNLVIVDHGGQTFSLYGHLSEFSVGRGSAVRERQEIARVGASPTGTPSLYFELRVNGRAVDPLAWLSPVR